MATNFSIAAWRVPWTEEPGGIQTTWDRKESDVTEATERDTQLFLGIQLEA